MGNTPVKPKSSLELFIEICINNAKNVVYGTTVNVPIPNDIKLPYLETRIRKECNSKLTNSKEFPFGVSGIVDKKNKHVILSRAIEFVDIRSVPLDRKRYVAIRSNNIELRFNFKDSNIPIYSKFNTFIQDIKKNKTTNIAFGYDNVSIAYKDKEIIFILNSKDAPVYTSLPIFDLLLLELEALCQLMFIPYKTYYHSHDIAGSIGCG